jgi:hypothetical protein
MLRNGIDIEQTRCTTSWMDWPQKAETRRKAKSMDCNSNIDFRITKRKDIFHTHRACTCQASTTIILHTTVGTTHYCPYYYVAWHSTTIDTTHYWVCWHYTLLHVGTTVDTTIDTNHYTVHVTNTVLIDTTVVTTIDTTHHTVAWHYRLLLTLLSSLLSTLHTILLTLLSSLLSTLHTILLTLQTTVDTTVVTTIDTTVTTTIYTHYCSHYYRHYVYTLYCWHYCWHYRLL